MQNGRAIMLRARFRFGNRISTASASSGGGSMARVALVTGGSRGIGAAISVALKAAGYTVAANYAGNDEAAAAFTAETGIPTYKWSVADYDACAAGIAQVEADLGPVDVLVNNAGITRDAMFHKMTPEPVERGDRHQPDRPVQHDPSAVVRHARPQVRAGDQHLARSTGRRARRGRPTIRRPSGRSGLHQGAGAGRRAGRDHRERDLPGLYRHRNGARRSTRRC